MDATSYLLGKKSSGGGSGEITITGGTTSKAGYISTIENLPYLKGVGPEVRYMFYSFNGDSIPKIYTSNDIVDASFMFNYCGKITELDVSGINTSNVTYMSNMFSNCTELITLDLSSFKTSNVTRTNQMFNKSTKLAVLDISSFDFTNISSYSSMFTNCGTQCLQTDGAYADGIPYVYVKDATAQNWVLTENNGHPSTWTTNNVIIKSS